MHAHASLSFSSSSSLLDAAVVDVRPSNARERRLFRSGPPLVGQAPRARSGSISVCAGVFAESTVPADVPGYPVQFPCLNMLSLPTFPSIFLIYLSFVNLYLIYLSVFQYNIYIDLSISPSKCRSIDLSMPLHTSIYQAFFGSFHLSIDRALFFICLSIHQSVSLSIYLSFHRTIQPCISVYRSHPSFDVAFNLFSGYACGTSGACRHLR
jgi:hypothetical protein